MTDGEELTTRGGDVGKAERVSVIIALISAIFGYTTVVSDISERVTVIEKVQEVEIKSLSVYAERLRIALGDVRRYFIKKTEDADRSKSSRFDNCDKR